MRKIGDNQDYMSREMDEELERLEELITALYTNAINEITAKFTDYMERHKQFLEDMRQAYDEGYLTEAEYQAKIRNILFNSLMYQATIDSLTKTLVNTDEAAMAIIRGDLPYVIGQSYNYIQSLGWAAADEAGYSTATFQIYNADAVQKLIKDNPDVLPYVDIPVDQKWNKDRLNTVITQAIIQGQTIPQVAQSMQQVAQMDKNTAIRTARTTMTYAENLGRDTSYENLKAQGMPVHKEWSAVIDDRTRPTHKLLNGTRANKDGLFGEGILNVLLRCPADPNGEPQEIYNCRCRLGVVFDDEIVDHSKDDELYEQFLKENYPQDYEKLLDKDYFNKHTSKPVKTENKGKAKAAEQSEANAWPTYKTANNRKEAVELLNDIGFGKVSSGVSKINEDVFVKTVNCLSMLNARFNAITEGMPFLTGKMNSIAYVSNSDHKRGSLELKLSTKYYNANGTILDKITKLQTAKWAAGEPDWWMPVAPDYYTVASITHEYGHMVENMLISKAIDQAIAQTGEAYWLYSVRNSDKITASMRNEITEIAKSIDPNYTDTNGCSLYGQSKDSEFFAEAFMNAFCGEPNTLGKAMLQWLEGQGL